MLTVTLKTDPNTNTNHKPYPTYLLNPTNPNRYSSYDWSGRGRGNFFAVPRSSL